MPLQLPLHNTYIALTYCFIPHASFQNPSNQQGSLQRVPRAVPSTRYRIISVLNLPYINPKRTPNPFKGTLTPFKRSAVTYTESPWCLSVCRCNRCRASEAPSANKGPKAHAGRRAGPKILPMFQVPALMGACVYIYICMYVCM